VLSILIETLDDSSPLQGYANIRRGDSGFTGIALGMMLKNTQYLLSDKTLRACVIGLGLVLVVGGCSGVRDTLGLGKNAPDEFSVVKKAPLILPPDYKLRPPRPGAQRPTAVMPVDEARSAVFGKKTTPGSAAAQGQNILLGNKRPSVPKSTGELALLDNAGADPSQANVRSLIRHETTSVADKGKSFSDRLMFWQSDDNDATGDVTLNAGKESARLEKATAQGKPASTIQAPVIRRKKQTLLGDLF
jgi:hypothetical protein